LVCGAIFGYDDFDVFPSGQLLDQVCQTAGHVVCGKYDGYHCSEIRDRALIKCSKIRSEKY
jgi:hypothetical protein